MAKKKNVTLDELARMVAEGFEKTAGKAQLEQVSTRLERVERTAEHQAASLEYITERVDAIESLLGDDYRGRIERLESIVEKLKAKIGS